MNLIVTAVLILLTLVAVLGISLAASFGAVGVGWIVTRVFSDLSLFEASLIATIMSALFLFAAYRILVSPVGLGEPGQEEWEEEWDEEEEFEPPIVPWRRSKLTDQARSSSEQSGRSSKRKKRR